MLVEWVARAISEAAGELDAADMDCLGWDEYVSGQNAGSLAAEAIARAAIKAIRQFKGLDGQISVAMIDEALK